MKSTYAYLTVLALFGVTAFGVYFKNYRETPIDLEALKAWRSQYSEAELQYFTELAFQYPNMLRRWTKPIQIMIDSTTSKENKSEVYKIMKEIAGSLNHLTITVVDKEPNLTILFPKLDVFEQNRSFGPRENNWLGYAKPHLTLFSPGIDCIEVYVRPGLPKVSRFRVLRHEILHALGLFGHGSTHLEVPNLMGKIIFKSITDSEHWMDNAYTPALDLKALEMIYSPVLPVGLRKETFLRLLEKTR